jgi:hypothetical protein
MSGSSIVNGLMIFFSATTVAVIAYPIIKLLPSWLERSVYRKIDHHRGAIAALGLAIDRADDAAHRARLVAQQDWNRAALAALAPHDVAAAVSASARVDAAA